MKKLLKNLYNHKIMNKEEAKSALFSLTDGSANSSQIASFLTVFLMRDITVDELDGFQWYCDKCHSLLYEKYIPLTDIVSQLPPLFEIFWADDEARKCKECNAYLEKT